MSNLKIFGNPNPVVGVKEYYSINDFFGDSSSKQNILPEYQVASNDQVKWSVWIFDKGSWRKTKENNKTGITVDYIFYQKSLIREGIKLSVEVNGEKAIFDIKPLRASQAKIVHVDLLNANLSKPTKPFVYGDWIVARVHCVGMDRFSIKATLWEDDGGKTKQNTTNVRIQEKIGNVLNGIADVSFYLDPSNAWLANMKLAEGDTNEGEYHEYYVTAEFLERKLKRVPSLNTNVPNPDYKPEVVIKQTPAEKKGPSKKEEKGINKSENKVYDYHEAKVAIKPTTDFNPVWEKINSLMKVNTDNNWWKKKEEKKNGICESEARVRAFMRMLRVKEDTVGDSGYEKNVGGKSFIKDYKKDWSTHPKISIYIKRINKNSNAAGAYQFMGDTYDEIIRNYGKRYKISNFTKESQDKMCLILMKHYYKDDRPNSFYNPESVESKEWRKRFKNQQADIIQLIIDDDIKRAALLSSLCWASLPDSPYGQQSSLYTFIDVKKIYDSYLKEELVATSNELYLKKGFLKEFGYSCCDGYSNSNTGCSDKSDIDLRNKMTFYAQKTSTDCNITCRKIMKIIDIYPENPTEQDGESYYQTALETKDRKGLTLNIDNFKKGINYIDKSLEEGYPIMVGVHHSNIYKYNETSVPTTDHYVIIVGRFCDNNVLKYRFWDVGTKNGEINDYKFTKHEDKLYSDEIFHKGKSYVVSQIRRNKKIDDNSLITF
ncbi:glycoside hydrolase family 104 protein [Flavobacterium sp. PS2]|uniref:glycoside hydrolase family 24 protein n=1 Tax=Flavobacterium sp. PS2 TaxID=3384157 RepID=UPI00390C4FC5